MIIIIRIILFAISDSSIIPLFINILPCCHYLSLPMLNNALIAAPTPNKEKINSNQGAVPNKPSKYLPSRTPINTDAAIVIPICENCTKARNVSLLLG